MRTHVHSADADVVLKRIQAGIFDFGVVVGPVDKNGYHFLSLPGLTAWGVLVRTDSPLATQATISRSDLIKQRVIIPQQHVNVNVLTDWLGRSDYPLHVVATYNLLNNAATMAAGVGVVLCLADIINTVGSDLRFVPLALNLTSQTSLIWMKNRPLSPAANAFLRALQATVTQG